MHDSPVNRRKVGIEPVVALTQHDLESPELAPCAHKLALSSGSWYARQDSNLRPLAPEASALSAELRARTYAVPEILTALHKDG